MAKKLNIPTKQLKFTFLSESLEINHYFIFCSLKLASNYYHANMPIVYFPAIVEKKKTLFN